MTARARWFLALASIVCLATRPCGALASASDSELAAACAACHRSDGHDTGIPPIATLDENRIVQMMLAYRVDAHRSQIMHVIAGALSTEEIAAIARELARQRAAGR